jgi:thiol-disulfide isomerase/thioredoxin
MLTLFVAGGIVAMGREQEPAPTVKTSEPPSTRDGALITLYHPVPALTGDKALWLNTEKPIAFEKGKVYVVHFWTFGCINCQRNLPHYSKWAKKFGKEVTIIGVHTPETESEKRFANMQNYVTREKIPYAVLFDPKNENWNRWQQQVWPTVYLIDKQGRVRYYWVGELEWKNAGGEAKMRGFIEKLLAEKPAVSTTPQGRG